MSALIWFLAAFSLGSFPTAYFAGRWFGGTDIRRHGSGNVGATNALRVLGKKLGVAVFVVDFMKGFLPVWLAHRFGMEKESALWIGFGAALGHIFTPFLGFKGGKGVATGAGLLCAAFPFLFLLSAAVWLLVFLTTRLVSLGSLVALFSLVIFSLIFQLGVSAFLFFCCTFLLMAWTHRSNLRRIFSGTEKRL